MYEYSYSHNNAACSAQGQCGRHNLPGMPCKYGQCGYRSTRRRLALPVYMESRGEQHIECERAGCEELCGGSERCPWMYSNPYIQHLATTGPERQYCESPDGAGSLRVEQQWQRHGGSEVWQYALYI